jgi:hypothetical protein
MLDDGADAYKIGEYLDQMATHTIGVPWKDTVAMQKRHRELGEVLVALN